MASAPIGVPDLSIVTNTLLNMLGNFLHAAGATSVNLTAAMPEAMRHDSGCQMTFSLFHVSEDKFQRNSPLLNKRAQGLPFQPMSLDLYYLLTAFCNKDYQQEQQAMSLALQFFYRTPILRIPVTIPGIVPPVNEEFTLTMEIENSDELARLWQAITVPFRLSAVYRIAVVLLTPPATPFLALPVRTAQLSANPTLFPYSLSGEVIATVRTHSFATPPSTPAVPEIVNVDYSPAIVAPQQRFFLYGANLNQAGPPPASATSFRVYLIMPDGTEIEVTNPWKVTETNPAKPNFQTNSRITLDLPATVGAPPLNAPPPGVYQLRVGSNNPPDAVTNRTNSTAFSVAARVDVSVVPPNAPILVAVAGDYTLHGEGFIAGHSAILLDTIALTENLGGPPLDGQFTVNSGQQITFRAPAGLALGRYTVRVRVNEVESPPSWWIVK